MVPEHRLRPRLADGRPEFRRHVLRRPEEVGVVGKDDGDESCHGADGRRGLEEVPYARKERFLFRNAVASGRRPRRTVLQCEHKEKPKQKAGAAEHHEHVAPCSEKPQGPRGDHAGRHKPKVKRTLVYGKRDGARLLVESGDQRRIAWAVEALADPRRYRPEEHHDEERRHDEPEDAPVADKAHHERHERPRHKRTGNYPLARETVSDRSGDERHAGERPAEDRVDPADLDIREAQVQKPEQRPVRLVEEERATEHRHKNPLVGLGRCRGFFAADETLRPGFRDVADKFSLHAPIIPKGNVSFGQKFRLYQPNIFVAALFNQGNTLKLFLSPTMRRLSPHPRSLNLADHAYLADAGRVDHHRARRQHDEFTVSDFIATLNYHSHVEADDYGHSLTPPRQICRAWCRAMPRLVARSVLRGRTIISRAVA